MRSSLLLGTAMACALHAGFPVVPAFAQTAKDQPSASWVAEIVVTAGRQSYAELASSSATRTDTLLIETPQSVQVITRSLLQEQDRRTLGDALINVSGVTPTRSAETLLIPPIVRGFPAEVYLDGLPIFAGNQQAHDPGSLLGVERIEVLKGPSATLYGGGLGTPLGGVINIQSTRPGDRAGGYVAMRAGGFSTWNPYGEFDLPLAQGISARIAAEHQSYESWIDQVEGELWSVQPSLSFRLGAATDLLVQGRFSHRSDLEYSGLPADMALAGLLERNAFPGSPVGQPRTENDSRMGTVILRHAFSDHVTAMVTGRYYRGDVDESGSFVYPDMFPADPAAPTVYPVVPISMDNRTEAVSLDANLAARLELLGGEHVLLGGVNYDRTSFYSGMGLFVQDTPSGVIDLADPVYDLIYTPQTPVNSYTDDRFETFAFYVQDQANYGRLHLTGGAARHLAQVQREQQYRCRQRQDLHPCLAPVRGDLRCGTGRGALRRLCDGVPRALRLHRVGDAGAADVR